MSHPNYNSHGRSLRPSPPGGDSHSGSLYPEQGHGRTTLPPLTIAFPTSDPPVSNNYPNYPTTQQRSTPVPYEQNYYSTPQPQPQAGYTNYPGYQQLSDTRYPGGQAYGSYNRASPSSSSADVRRLPPLSVPSNVPPRDDRWHGSHGSQYYHTDLQMPPTSSDMRSPQAAYSPAPSYPQYQSLTATAYPQGHSASRGHGTALPPANPNYHQPMPMGPALPDRTVPSARNPQLPYPPPRVPPVMSPVEPPQLEEPAIKKKRKRADARQLEVLNAVYARTAFPSTEERLKLANDLDMPPRSVQIWFQNKRQSARQAERNAANPPPPILGPASSSTSSTPSVSGYRGSPGLVSPAPLIPTYPSRSPPPPPVVRSGQTPSPPQASGRSRDMDPRRQWPRGY